MLLVTEKAVEAMTQALDANEVREEQGLRLAVNDEGGFGLTVDEQHEGDQVVARGERTVLFVEPAISSQLDGAVLDVAESPEGRRLTLRMGDQEEGPADA